MTPKKAAGAPRAVGKGPEAAPAPVVTQPGPPAPLGLGVKIALAITLAVLLVHSFQYAFLTDDAFISFRYARNFAQGHGLVFNPGAERVEGYSNFLWVLILAALDRIGMRPEQNAIPLSLLATVGLWWVVVRFVVRHRPAGVSPWWVMAPPAFLAISRSVAVWSTSGLETRLFELLATWGLIRLAEETDAARTDPHPRAPWGATLLGLAALTRPDGALICFLGLAASAGIVWWARRPSFGAMFREKLLRAWPALVLIAGHYVFRKAYYGEWAPNTYYAKVGGVLHPSAGFEYLEAFTLEYAAILWLLPMGVAIAALAHSRLRSWAIIASVALVPHLAYVVAIGGDHFEYRPLTVLFPWIGILVGDGLARIASAPRRRPAAIALVVAIVVGATYLPWQSHTEYPHAYSPGFPGLQVAEGPLPSEEAIPANEFLDPDRAWLTRLPLFRTWGLAHRDILRRITSYYSGIRAEEHRLFFNMIRGEGAAIRALMDDGRLPKDAWLAMDCVGAIPYITNANVIDRLGLTDAHVSHQPFTTTLIAHGKQASFSYAQQRNVDLWFFHPAQLVIDAASSRGMRAFEPLAPGEPDLYVAPLDRDRWLMARLPLGIGRARERMPNLHFWDMRDSADVRAARGAAIAAWRAKLETHPRDTEAHDGLAFLYAAEGRWADAAVLYADLAAIAPRDPDPLVNLAACYAELGRTDSLRLALQSAAVRARALGDGRRAAEIEVELGRAMSSGAASRP